MCIKELYYGARPSVGQSNLNPSLVNVLSIHHPHHHEHPAH